MGAGGFNTSAVRRNMGREKRRKYWYGSVLNMIKHYDQIKIENSERARTYTKAI